MLETEPLNNQSEGIVSVSLEGAGQCALKSKTSSWTNCEVDGVQVFEVGGD